MNIEILLTETEIAQEFSDAMEARDLPEKFFYWFPLSVRAWMELSRDASYESLRQPWNIVSAKVKTLTKHFGPAVSVVSFGAGDGSKDRLLLEALRGVGHSVRYFPVDASQALLEVACSTAEETEIDTLGIKADISSPVHLVLASDASESPKIFLMAGNTLGGFDPLEQIRHIGQCLHDPDRLIIDGEICDDSGPAIPDNPLLRRFAFAPLSSIGLTEEDGELRFDCKRDERHKGLYLITKHFRANRDLRVTVSAEEIMLERGERIFMNFRYVYSRDAFRWLLQEHGRLKMLEEIAGPEGKSLTAVCAK